MSESEKTSIARVIADQRADILPSRVVEYLNVRLEDYSRSGLKKLVKNGLVEINGKRATTADWVNASDVIEIFRELDLQNVWKIPLSVRFEDEYIAVVHKPAGIPTSGYGAHNLTGALPHNIMLNTSEEGILPHPVHRLDRDTEGLVLIAKTRTASRVLGEQFKNGEIHKTYRAWVHGVLESSTELNWQSIINDQRAITRGSVLTADTERKLSLLELHPITGRTHQLRIHCAENDFPIVGDNKYGVDKGMRLKLIAYHLKFDHPILAANALDIRVSDKHYKRFDKILLG